MPASTREQHTLQRRVDLLFLVMAEPIAYMPTAVIGIEKMEQNAAIR